MKKHFAFGVVAISVLLAAISGSASARGLSRNVEATVSTGANPANDPKPSGEPHRSGEPGPAGAATGWLGESGTASFYGPAYHGRKAASGLRFNQEAMTAAHPWLPFGSKVMVSLPATGRTVIVTITDRLYSTRRIVDLSVAAARQLGMIRRGIAEVTLLPA